MTHYRPIQVLPLAARTGGCIRYASLAPPPHLEPCIVRYWSMQSRGRISETVHHRVVPDGCIDVIFDFASSSPRTAAISFGTARGPHVASLSDRVDYLGVCFRPGAFSTLFGVPANELTDQTVPLEDMSILPSSLPDSLASCSRREDQIALLNTTISQKLACQHAGNDRLNAAIAAVTESAGHIQTAQLARRAYLSPRQLRRLFDRCVGLSPKAFARVVRFQRVLRELKLHGLGHQLPLALTAGYYDHAHFLHEFHAFTGKSPTTLFSAAAD